MSLCTLPCRRPAEVGLICREHRDQLAELLDPRQCGQVFATPGERRIAASIPNLYAQLSIERPRRDPGPAGPPAFGPSSPGDDATIVLRDPRSRAEPAGPDDVERAPRPPLVVLAQLAERVIAERGAPEVEPRWSVPGLASWLYGCVDWIASQAWVGEAWHELRELSNALRVAAGDPPPGSVGTCRAIVDDEGREDPHGVWRCAVPLYMPEMPPHAPDEPVQLPTLRCGSCGHAYGPQELVRIGRQQEAA